MSRRKYQMRLQQHQRVLAPWTFGVLGLAALLMVAIYVGTMPL